MTSRLSSIFVSSKYSVVILIVVSLSFSLSVSSIFYKGEHTGDEGRYVGYAQNLVSGSFSPPGTRSLGNGPGYSFLIYPFIALWGNENLAVLLNPIMYTLSMFIFYKTACLFSSRSKSLQLAYLLLLYWPVSMYLPMLLCEILTFFLMALFIYFIITGLSKPSPRPRHMIAAGLVYALLILTKPIFAYVLYGVMFLFTVSYVLKIKSKCYTNIAIFVVSALLLSHVYFIYTYQVTGKLFYWLNQSSPLWSMSVLEDDELGSYISETRRLADFPQIVELTEGMDPVATDSVYKQIAIENIKSNPRKYIDNWINNISRYLFNYPFSHTQQKLSTMFYLLPNSIIIFMFLASLKQILSKLTRNDSYMYILLAVIFIYSFGSTLVCSNGRRIIPVIPLMYLAIQYTKNMYNNSSNEPDESNRNC